MTIKITVTVQGNEITRAQAEYIQQRVIFAKVAKIAKTKNRSFGENPLLRTRVIYIVRQIAKKIRKVSIKGFQNLYQKSFRNSWRFWRKPAFYQYKSVRQNAKKARQFAKTGCPLWK